MKIINISSKKPSIEEILGMAKTESILIKGMDGEQYMLEKADEFEREVAILGESERFMDFLRQRSEEKSGRSLKEIAEELEACKK